MKIIINKNPGYSFLRNTEFPIVVKAKKHYLMGDLAYSVKAKDLIEAAKLKDVNDLDKVWFNTSWNFYHDVKEI